jgi:hypothetical protein
MYITSLSQITPDLSRIVTSRAFQESFVGYEFSKNVKQICLYNYKQSLVGVQFPETLDMLELINHTQSLVGVKFNDQLETLSLSYYNLSLDGINLPNQLKFLELFNYPQPIKNVKFPESLQEILIELPSPLECDFPHGVIIKFRHAYHKIEYEFIKKDEFYYYYSYLKYPREHFIKSV